MRTTLIRHIKYSRPLIIAGPCSIESRNQFFSTVEALQKIPHIHAIRAGVWKPRTQPDCFEGLGQEALSWFKEIKSKYSLPIITEVADESQVMAALKSEVDGFWIGARSSVNPFLLDSLFNIIARYNPQIPVFIKNPLAPDLKLWIGAVLRAKKAKLENLVLIHRGFAAYPSYANLRSEPQWDLALKMRQQYPELPMLIDPSHMAGSREMILPLSLCAKHYQMDGIFVESHIAPEKALTDREQQLSPKALADVLEQYFQTDEAGEDFSVLADYRSLIDVLDQRLLQVLSERMQVVEKIALIKHRQGISLHQESRFKQMLQQWQGNMDKYSLKEEFLQSLFELIHRESLSRQEAKIINIKD